MRLLAISIVVLAGALAAGVGVMAESLPSARRFNSLDDFGMIVAGIGLVVFGIEWWTTRSSEKEK